MKKLPLTTVVINYESFIRIEDNALRFRQPSWPNTIRNVRNFLLELGKKLGFKKMEDWYSITSKDLEENIGGKELLTRYNFSPINAIRTAFPEYNWEIWKFSKTPTGYWTNKENQRALFDRLAEKLKIKHWEDWYKVNFNNISQEKGSSSVLFQYDSHICTALSSVYSEYDWKLWKFKHLPRNFWADSKNVRALMDELYEELHLQSMEDWYSVSISQLKGLKNVSYFGPLPQILMTAYPEYKWDAHRFKQHPSKIQIIFFNHIKRIFPEHEVHFNYAHPELESLDSNRNLTLDVYIPSLRIAFEYQGEHHYSDKFSNLPLHKTVKRSLDKRSLCMQSGIRLVEMPYWWDKKEKSLKSTIVAQNPELLKVLFPNVNSIEELFEKNPPVSLEKPK